MNAVRDDVTLALQLADQADALTLDRFGALDLHVDTKPDLTPVTDADRMYAAVLQTTGTDPLPYGVEPNRAVLEQLMEFAMAQRILTRPVALDEVFAA